MSENRIIDTTQPVNYFIGPEESWGRSMALPRGIDPHEFFDQIAPEFERMRQFFIQQSQVSGKVGTELHLIEMFRAVWVMASEALKQKDAETKDAETKALAAAVMDLQSQINEIRRSLRGDLP